MHLRLARDPVWTLQPWEPVLQPSSAYAFPMLVHHHLHEDVEDGSCFDIMSDVLETDFLALLQLG